jgi:Amt family ammonium transporter
VEIVNNLTKGVPMRPTQKLRFLTVSGAALATAIVVLCTSVWGAADANKVDSGDTAWVLASSALVLLMTAPGLAFFYAGMVRRKNALATLMQSFMLTALISVQWALWGYSVAFAPGNWFVGGLQWVGLAGVSATAPYPDYAATIPHQAYMVFQCMFAELPRH